MPGTPALRAYRSEDLTEAWTALVPAETLYTVAQKSGKAVVQSTAATDNQPQSLSNLAAPQEEEATAESQDGNTSLADDGAPHRTALRAVRATLLDSQLQEYQKADSHCTLEDMAPLDNVIPQPNDGWPTKLYTIEGGAKKPRNIRRHESKLKAALYEAMVEAHQDARDCVVSDDE